MNHILIVGQCCADYSRISDTINQHYEIEIKSSDTHQDALIQIQNTAFDLVLVNRIFDKTQTEGLDLIREIKASPATKEVPIMLISNYDSAQTDAVDAGAVPGFGKAALNQDSTFKILDQYLLM